MRKADKTYAARRNARGMTLIDAALLAATLGAFVRLVIPNVREFTTRASDASAMSVYNDIKDTISDLAGAPDGPPTSLVLNQQGVGILPSPFHQISLSRGIRVNYLISLHYPGFFDLYALEVSHDGGAHFYRMVEINNKRIEQVILK